MADFDMTHGAAMTAPAAAGERVAAFLRAAYGWMCAGLAITAATAWFIASSPSLLRTIVRERTLFWGLVDRAARHRLRAVGAGPAPVVVDGVVAVHRATRR